MINHRQPHTSFMLFDGEQCPGGADVDTLHAEETGAFYDIDDRGSGTESVANIEQFNTVVGTNFDTAAAANTFARIAVLHNCTGRSQQVVPKRGGRQGFGLCRGRNTEKPGNRSEKLKNGSPASPLFAQRKKLA